MEVTISSFYHPAFLFWACMSEVENAPFSLDQNGFAFPNSHEINIREKDYIFTSSSAGSRGLTVVI
ncbi:hypothetical protein JHK85_034817 [Glycine max]|uniref:Uncharacterized protein n=1 Tax=Glycine max TaxID=3847 RepID=K7LVA5_SOYBN|nr:hypothetical protein JHK85_034817 [Glycine max]KAH1143486.1 hypothetical protein GYH30_033969 [Glycine max]